MKIIYKILVFMCLLLGLCVNLKAGNVFAEEVDDVQKQLEEEVNSQVKDIDLSEFDEFVNSLESEELEIFGDFNFKTLVQKIIDGSFTLDFGSVFKTVLQVFKSSLAGFLPYVALLMGVALLSGMFSVIKPKMAEESVGKVIYFACFSVIVIICMKICGELAVSCVKNIKNLVGQMEVTFPILLSLMTAVGGIESVKIYSPAVSVLSNGIIGIILSVLIPIFFAVLVLTIVGHLSDNIKLDKFVSLLNSCYKWIVGIVGTIFIGFLAVSGMTASSVDGVSVRTAKYAIKNYVPVLGGYISEGFEVVLASSVLLKNGIGFCALILMLASVISPILSLIATSLAFKLIAALVEPVCDAKMSNFFAKLAKCLNILITVLIAVSLLYFLTVSLLIATANNIF